MVKTLGEKFHTLQILFHLILNQIISMILHLTHNIDAKEKEKLSNCIIDD